ncbi:phosphoglycerate dehydrogenase [Balneolales bacterium ANBcel1]|nr:phosphoglycerate dehydrogenase [Balneolales bacterium ANBcel1]
MAYKALLLDGVDPVCGEIFEQRGFEVTEASGMQSDELEKIIGDYHAMVVRSATKVTLPLLEKAVNMRVVGRAGVGVDNIDLDAATRMGILVMNTPDGNTISTAEHTCGMILALSRNIPAAVSSLKEGRWDRKKYLGTEIHGKTLGIIGLGKIGSGVAARMKSFGMHIIGFDPYTTHERAAEMGVEMKGLDEILASADYLTVHTPLTDQTRDLVSQKNADRIKPGIKLINCARGGIYNESDLLSLIERGIVSGAALDVYSNEPPSDDLKELLQHPAVICTPHLGASTQEAQGKVAEQIARQIADAIEQKGFQGSLNGKSIALSTNKEVQPFLQLAERFGHFLSQIAPKHTEELSITYSGTCAKHSQVLTDSLLSGFMKGSVDDVVNLINARYHAETRGLKISETISRETQTYSDLITVDLGPKADYRKLCATPFGENDYRIVSIDGFSIEIHLEGEIILYQNIDKPGMLAATSGALAKRDINIASLSLGRDLKNAQAITAFTVDTTLDEKDVDYIHRIDGVNVVKYVSIRV